MKSAKQYNEMTQKAAFQIVKAMSVFDREPDHIRHQAEQLIMQRVQRMRGGGDSGVIEGDHLIKEFVEPPTPAPTPAPEPEPTPPENPETDTPAP